MERVRFYESCGNMRARVENLKGGFGLGDVKSD
jgi:hypothetical protein